jgi:hypothetical protein
MNGTGQTDETGNPEGISIRTISESGKMSKRNMKISAGLRFSFYDELKCPDGSA